MSRAPITPEAAFKLGKAAAALTLAREAVEDARAVGAFEGDLPGLPALILGQLQAIENYLFELGHDHGPPADNVKPRVRGTGGFGSTGDT